MCIRDSPTSSILDVNKYRHAGFDRHAQQTNPAPCVARAWSGKGASSAAPKCFKLECFIRVVYVPLQMQSYNKYNFGRCHAPVFLVHGVISAWVVSYAWSSTPICGRWPLALQSLRERQHGWMELFLHGFIKHRVRAAGRSTAHGDNGGKATR